jgi:uncharacterized PurR-regulated membrane protein YhhQ (DUF165 family)
MGYAIGYLLTIVAANAAVQRFGFVPVGFGLMAPAGVFAAGLSLSLRDGTQDRLGRRWCVAVIVAGAALSFLLGSGRIAVASGVAFLLSELCDYAVYTPLRERGRKRAVFLSNVVGAAVDSALFLLIAFGSVQFFAGQMVGKVEATIAVVAVMAIVEAVRGVVSERRGERGYAHVGD